MKMEQYIRAIAGSFITISVLLSYLYSPYWLFFTAFVGLNLLQSAFTKWCPMIFFLEKLGVPRDNERKGNLSKSNAKHPYTAATNR
ncbi:MAG: DUF2892 domain-containing protein [Syntrophales bacterium]|nr:DUF2892 domain-containing protein [Syntrophales bacterium]